MKNFELWADSFHEGDWMCANIGNIINKKGGTTEVDYINNFIPKYFYKVNNTSFTITVFGNYNAWKPIHKDISDLLLFGKPDGILYDTDNNSIIFVIEETAATPTGNQALQRSERLYGSSKFKYPFWYLLSEFGIHKDGGNRRDSIWPTIQAIKLSIINQTPSIVLHYSDTNNPEDYSLGSGVENLFTIVTSMIINLVNNKEAFLNTDLILQEQYQNMIDFIDSQWKNILTYLPGEQYLKDKNLAKEITAFVLKKSNTIPYAFTKGFLIWPTIDKMPKDEIERLKSNGILKYDRLSYLLEKAVDDKKAYILSSNAGSGRPPSKKQLLDYIRTQKNAFDNTNIPSEPVNFNMAIEDFPLTKTGRYHVTTAKNIIYLFDTWSDLKKIIINAYPRLENKLGKYDKYNQIPTMIYISNSLSKGRIYGDPYTGQLCAFTFSLGHNIHLKRFVVTYYPHQVHNLYMPNRTNKGKTILSDIAELSIYHGGVAIDTKTKEIF